MPREVPAGENGASRDPRALPTRPPCRRPRRPRPRARGHPGAAWRCAGSGDRERPCGRPAGDDASPVRPPGSRRRPDGVAVGAGARPESPLGEGQRCGTTAPPAGTDAAAPSGRRPTSAQPAAPTPSATVAASSVRPRHRPTRAAPATAALGIARTAARSAAASGPRPAHRGSAPGGGARVESMSVSFIARGPRARGRRGFVELPQGVVETRVDRPDRDVEPPGDLVGREVAVVPQRDDDPVVRRQRREGLLDRVALVGPRVRVGGGERELVRDVDGRARRDDAQPIPAGVDEDPVEPRLESFRVAEGRPLAPRLDERVVGRVLRLGLVAQDHPGEPIGGVEVLVGERLERGGRGRPGSGRLGLASGHVDSLACAVHDHRRRQAQKPSNGVLSAVPRPRSLRRRRRRRPAASSLDAPPPQVDPDADRHDRHEGEDRARLLDEGREHEGQQRDAGR